MNTLKTLIEQLKKVSLTSHEQKSVKDRLVHFMTLEPRTKELLNKAEKETQALPVRMGSPFGSWLRVYPVPFALLVFMILGGSVAFGANEALPGDLFYPIKIAGESVRVALALSVETKANYESELASRRLAEAEQLAAKGELNLEAQAVIESDFSKHVLAVKAHINELESKEDLEAALRASSSFENAIAVHAQILEGLSTSENDSALSISLMKSGTSIGEITGRAVEEIREAKERGNSILVKLRAQVKAGAEMGTTAKVDAEMKITIAKTKLEEAKKYIANTKTRFGKEAVAEAEAQFFVAEEIFLKAKVALEADAYSEAFALSEEVIKRSNSALSAAKLGAQATANLDVSSEKLDPTEIKSSSENSEMNAGVIIKPPKPKPTQMPPKNPLDLGAGL